MKAFSVLRKELNEASLAVGDIIRINKDRLDANEDPANEYVILDLRGPRLLIQSVEPVTKKFSIVPTESVKVTDVYKVKGKPTSKAQVAKLDL